jgi:hypothetical protein
MSRSELCRPRKEGDPAVPGVSATLGIDTDDTLRKHFLKTLKDRGLSAAGPPD